jgi:transposase
MRPAAGGSGGSRTWSTGRWRVAHDRWHTGIIDAAGTGGLLAHVDGRTAARVTEWLLTQPDWWRVELTHVTIDLSASYLRAVTDALPDAVVVADRFHLVQLANDTLTQVRQRATRAAHGRRGRKKDPEWAGRRRLLTAHERLTPEALPRLWNVNYRCVSRLRRLLCPAGSPSRRAPRRPLPRSGGRSGRLRGRCGRTR